MSEELRLDRSLKLLSVVGAVATFIWGVWVWKDNSEKELAAAASEAAKHAETQLIEATKPFLNLQLALYTEASQITAKIATSGDSGEVAAATKRFWELYWGELALVENSAVAKAMKDFGEALRQKATQDRLERLAIGLAHAIRKSLALSWGTKAWEQ